MKRFLRAGVVTAALCVAAGTQGAEETFDDAIQRAAAEYGARYENAIHELNSARERMGREKAPLLLQLRATEDELIAVETALTRLPPNREKFENERRG